MSNKPVKSKGTGLRVLDGALVVAVGVVGVVIAFAVLHFVVGALWELVKVAVIVGVVGGILWAIARRRRR
jgi:membrane protease YdiL (CAAX protease family)